MSHHAANRSYARFKILKHTLEINPPILTQEFERRKLDLNLCRRYFGQVYLLDRRNNQRHYALTFRNNGGGHQIVIPNPDKKSCQKGVIGRMGYTFITGQHSSHIEVFRSYWDFLTWLTITKRTQPKFDTYIINAFENVPATIRDIETRIDEIKSIVDFLPNNPSGEFTRELISEFAGINYIDYGPQNYIFGGHNDLSSFWMNISETDGFINSIS